jgi:hypothetical protein
MTYVAGADHAVTIDFTQKQWANLARAWFSYFDRGSIWYLAQVHYKSHLGRRAVAVTLRNALEDEEWADFERAGVLADSWDAE